MVLLKVAVPKFRLLMMPQKSCALLFPVCGKGSAAGSPLGCGFRRSQFGVQSPLASIHVRVTLVAMRDVGLPRP